MAPYTEHMATKGCQARVIVLSSALLTRVDQLVDDPESDYESFSELVATALRNQLELEQPGGRAVATGSTPGVASSMDVRPMDAPARALEGHELLTRPTSTPDEIADAVDPSAMRPLTFLTNRINPVPVVVRGLANLGTVPVIRAHNEISALARTVGLSLQTRDRRENRPMNMRLATSWPVGEDAEKSAAKFIASYMLDEDGRGPLHDLGLARVVNGEVRLTELGYALASSAIPLVGEAATGNSTVGSDARRILVDALMANPSEADTIAVFLAAVDEHDGQQAAADSALMTHFGWQAGVAVSNRAALLGRLKDVQILTVNGRGPDAVINLTEPGRQLRDQTRAGTVPAAERCSGGSRP